MNAGEAQRLRTALEVIGRLVQTGIDKDGYKLNDDEALAEVQEYARDALAPSAGRGGDEVSVPTRATSLGPQDIYLLDQWGRQLMEAFKETPYLVGSVARAADNWRDVDIRMLIPMVVRRNRTLSASLAIRTLNMALSLWGRQVTGLPIDFQMQDSEEFHSYDNQTRNPMGPRSKTQWNLASAGQEPS